VVDFQNRLACQWVTGSDLGCPWVNGIDLDIFFKHLEGISVALTRNYSNFSSMTKIDLHHLFIHFASSCK
jgi:hypothetical protein